jgi:septal ring factor EnvC (AmiA/AmiB activator)
MLDLMIRNRAALAFSGAGLWLLAAALPALAQTPPRDPKVVETELRAADERRRALETEAEAIRMDRTRLNAALIETNSKMRQTQARMAEIEKRLDVAGFSEAAIRKSLDSRRAVLAEVLAVLQRMRRGLPPAVLASPEDALRSVRTAMMLGAVLPELRSEAQSLASDLNDLVELRKTIAQEKERMAAEAQTFVRDNEKLATLMAARQISLKDTEQKLAEQRQRLLELAKQSSDFKELILRSETEIAAAGRGAQEARAADAAQARNPRAASMPFSDPARLAPKIAFADAKGLLPIPVSGKIIKAYGASDGIGGIEKGLSLATRPGVPVASPADGWVAFSAPYRTYGQLLIINAGGGYYVVLAGMERISVDVGQFVLAGEPVATMGDGSARTALATASALGASQPILYVEFRKDGTAIDPGPWWAKAELEKVRG